MMSKLKYDIPASIVVFLVALPLCLGIALASGAPLLSGIISGIIGGVVVGFLSRSHTSVSGPAAGLAAIVLASITQLGNIELFFAALLLAGLLQIIMGLLKTGFIANYVPSNVIKGLLAAIGILLILKQIPHAIGYDQDAVGEFSFLQPDGENTFSALLSMLNNILPGAVLISVVSVLILSFWDKIPSKKIRSFPPSLIVVVLSVGLNELFINFLPYLSIGSAHQVNLPPIDTDNLSSYIHLPDLSYFSDYRVFTVAITIAMVASLETLLNVEAVDKIDPLKRETPQNRELVAQGVGNMAAGFFGGIPVTSVIVRSSVNINAGNKTKLSAILHGIFMLVSVLALSSWLNRIPLAALAAILLVTGYKLAKISLFKEMYSKGAQQFIPFVVTIVAIVLTDLLTGILIGLTVSIFYLLRSNFRNAYTMGRQEFPVGEVVRLELSEEVSFLNKASIKDVLWKIPEGSKAIIDATNSEYIDEDVLELINDFKTTVAPDRNIQLNILGIKDRYESNDLIRFTNVLDKKTQQSFTPEEVLEFLKKGNQRFVKGEWSDKYYHHQISATSSDQNPVAVIVSCIDSRTSPEIVFDAGIGDLLSIRIAGNIISPAIIGSIELSVKKIGAKLIVVMGHSNCGAIGAAIKKVNEENIGFVTSKINKAIEKCGHSHEEINVEDAALIKEITCLNAENSIAEILEGSPYLRSGVKKGEVGIVAAYYDTSSGSVEFSAAYSEPQGEAAVSM
jgi:carbonic anhydrase